MLVLLALGCGDGLERACLQNAVGDPLGEVQDRMDDVLRVKAYPQHHGDPATYYWQRQVGMGAQSCYVYVDERQRVERVDYHEGN